MNHDDYNKHSIDATLSRIETKIDMLSVKIESHERDIESLKRWRWIVTGGTTVVAALLGAVIDHFAK